jgi:hypothetical protein
MELSRLLLGLLLVVDIAHGAAGRAWEGTKGPRAVVPTLKQAATAVPVIPIIDDPLGDHSTPPGNPIVDIETVAGGSDGINVTLKVNFSPDTVMSNVVGFIDLDTDQDPTTGMTFQANSFIPGTTQDIGIDFVLSLFNLPVGGPVDVVDAHTGALVGSVPATIIGEMLEVTVPLAMLGGDDGTMNVGMVLGNISEPTDAAPNVGHGAILASGKAIISPGSSTLVTTQILDLVFILDTFGDPITSMRISLNGADITAAVMEMPPVHGSTPTGQLTAWLPGVGAALLGPGLHTLSIVVTTPAGTCGNTMMYEVIPNME